MPVILRADTDFDQVTVKDPRGHEVILVKLDGVVHGYRNSCPHIGIGLDYGDGRCLHGERQLICSMHGALFAADTGYCTDGPCRGDSLQRVPVRVEGGKVVAE
jgi:nitrite reductase/ring-hydroxylating ferredoxin subunit